MAKQPRRPLEDVPIERLRECFSYNPKTGVLRWKIAPANSVTIGDLAGCPFGPRGYLSVRIKNKSYLVHRIVWAIYYGAWPQGNIDHKNRNAIDNRIVNLRLATPKLNGVNSIAKNGNRLPKGCYRLKGRRRWYSKIKIDGKIKNLGTFATAREAAAAFEREHRAAYGDFSRCEARIGHG
jgi:HNH endonuclease